MVLLSGYRGVVKIFEFWSLTSRVLEFNKEGGGYRICSTYEKIFWVGKLLTIEEIFGGGLKFWTC